MYICMYFKKKVSERLGLGLNSFFFQRITEPTMTQTNPQLVFAKNEQRWKTKIPTFFHCA